MELTLKWDRNDRAILLGAEVKIDDVKLNFSGMQKFTAYKDANVEYTYPESNEEPVVINKRAFTRPVTSVDRLAGMACMQSSIRHYKGTLLQHLQSDNGIALLSTLNPKNDVENGSRIKFIIHCYLSGMKLEETMGMTEPSNWYPLTRLPDSFNFRRFRIAPEKDVTITRT